MKVLADGVTILPMYLSTSMTTAGAGMTHGFGMVVLVLAGAGTTGDGVGTVLGVGTLVGAGTTGDGDGTVLGAGTPAGAGVGMLAGAGTQAGVGTIGAGEASMATVGIVALTEAFTTTMPSIAVEEDIATTELLVLHYVEDRTSIEQEQIQADCAPTVAARM